MPKSSVSSTVRTRSATASLVLCTRTSTWIGSSTVACVVDTATVHVTGSGGEGEATARAKCVTHSGAFSWHGRHSMTSVGGPVIAPTPAHTAWSCVVHTCCGSIPCKTASFKCARSTHTGIAPWYVTCRMRAPGTSCARTVKDGSTRIMRRVCLARVVHLSSKSHGVVTEGACKRRVCGGIAILAWAVPSSSRSAA